MGIALLILGLYFVIMPLVTLAHELGQACVPLWRGREVCIRLGAYTSRVWRIGRLQLGVGDPLRPWVGCVEVDGEAEEPSALALLLGPLVSLLLSLACFAAGGFVEQGGALAFALRSCAKGCLIQFFATALPLRYPAWLGSYAGLESDGLQIWKQWRERRERAH